MRNKTVLKYFIFSFLLFSLTIISSCNDNNQIKKETLAKAYVDILVIEEYYNNIDSISIEKEKVFEKYSIDSSNYYSTLKLFSSDQVSWDEFFKFANTYLDTLKANVKKPINKIEKL